MKSCLRRGNWGLWLLLAAVSWSQVPFPAYSQELPGASDIQQAPAPSSERSNPPLTDRQRQIAETFDRLCAVLVRLSQMRGLTAPDQVVAVERALREVETRQIAVRMAKVQELLSTEQLASAAAEQEKLLRDLQDLLEVLLSGDREKYLLARRKQVEQWLQNLEAITRRQRDLKGRSAQADSSPSKLAEEQSELAEETEKFRHSLQNRPTFRQGQQSEAEKAGGRGASRNTDDFGKPAGLKEAEDPSAGKDDQIDKPSVDSASQPLGPRLEAPPTEAQSPSSPEGRAGTAASAAEKKMLQAAEKLRKVDRQGAVADQEQAIVELERARAELERILRQLREEEVARMLRGIQARLERMLSLQRQIYQGTETTARRQSAGESREIHLEIARLAREENTVGWEADQLLLLLREDASAGAMLEATSQLRGDIRLVEELFAARDLGPLNLSTQQAIIAALQEMIDAVRDRLAEVEKGQEEPAGSLAGGAPPLVDLVAELRMLRTLQQRIRTRSEEYQKWLAEGTSENPRLRSALQELSARQARLQEIARELAVRAGQ